MNLRKLWDRYRIHALVGIGGITALLSLRSRQQQSAAIAAAATSPAVTSADPTAAYQQGLAAGAGLTSAGVAQGLAPTESALGLAGVSVGMAGSLAQGAQALAAGVTGDYLGFGSNLIGALSGLFMPVPAPIGPPVVNPPVVVPPVVVPPVVAPPYVAPPIVTPPPAAGAGTFVGYYAHTTPGSRDIFTVNQAGQITTQRTYAFSGGAAAVRRSTSGTMHWRYSSGPLNGWSLVPGRSGSFSITKYYRRADGSTYHVPISQTGS